jgi:hypothetical protein
MAVGAALVVTTVLIHFECLRILWERVPALAIRNRFKMLVIVFGTFVAHTLEVWCYAVAYWLFDRLSAAEMFGGEWPGNFLGYLYFSTVSYTSLGLGDMYPLGPVRLITGIEALNGLVLIAWTASFTYLSLQRYWSRTR